MVDVLMLIVTVIATAVTTAIAIQSRQLRRAAIRLSVGAPMESSAKLNRRRKRLLVYGAPFKQRDFIVVPCYFQVGNASGVLVTDVTLQLQYPSECRLADAVIVDDAVEMATVIKSLTDGNVTTVDIGSYVQEQAVLGQIPDGQTLIVPFFLRLPWGRLPDGLSDIEGQALARRIRASDAVSGVVIHATVWSANAAAVAEDFIVLACNARDTNTVYSSLLSFASALWEGRRPAPGLYWLMKPWRAAFNLELAELVLFADDPLSATRSNRLDPSVIFNAEQAVAQLEVPPWGYKGEAFDVQKYLASVQVRDDTDSRAPN